ncbi:DUF2790 domain-containing protein [Pseudomonas sp. IT-P100]|jgi:hypothetical protein|uniref:DUF2790 domain-containing protein n=1 Tax=Pseudomonas sp. IT-P100 TaxID=3026452 RepID=UPI0039E15D37
MNRLLENFSKPVIALTFAIVSSSIVAAPAEEVARTGMPLDIVKTISITDVSNACGIVPVELTYDDSQGQRHTVTYQVWGSACSGG